MCNSRCVAMIFVAMMDFATMLILDLRHSPRVVLHRKGQGKICEPMGLYLFLSTRSYVFVFLDVYY